MKNIYLVVTGLFLTLNVFAQVKNNASNRLTSENELIKQRMLNNRQIMDGTKISALKQSGSVLYIPIQFSIIGDDNGNGYIDIEKLLEMFCDINTDYNSIGVQFYLKNNSNSFRYINNTDLYNDAESTSSINYMTNNKIPTCINIYVGPSLSNANSSYYNPMADYIFMLNSIVDGTGKHGSQEIGHYFTLPHTFSGWEGTNFDNGTAPKTVMGQAVENVARTGSNANCLTAGDGFCDTEADYMSSLTNCPYSSGGLDPLGVPINPDESLIMSNYTCRSTFSAEQSNAVTADIISRGYDAFVLPTPNSGVNGSSIISTIPISGTSIQYAADITLSWNPTIETTGYLIWLKNVSTNETILKTIVYDTAIVVPFALIQPSTDYSWQVRPINQYRTCGSFSSIKTFSTLPKSSGLESNNSFDFAINLISNPTANNITLQISNYNNEKLSYLLYNIHGKLLNNGQITSKQTQINTASLPSAIYLIHVVTQDNIQVQSFKIIKN